jgi:hypothetical protein
MSEGQRSREDASTRARRGEAVVDLPALIAFVIRMSDELEEAWASALDHERLAELDARLLADWQAVVSVIQIGGHTSDAELSELNLDSTVPEDPLPLEQVAQLAPESDLQQRRRHLQQAQLLAFELVMNAVQQARRAEGRQPDRITGEAAAGWFESGAFALIRSRAQLLARVTDLLEQTESELVRAARGIDAPVEPPLQLPDFLTHRRLAAEALAHGDVEAGLLHELVAIRRFIAAIVGLQPDQLSGDIASWLGKGIEAAIVAKLESFEDSLRTGLGSDFGAAFLVARAMLSVIDRLIAAPPTRAIKERLAQSEEAEA